MPSRFRNRFFRVTQDDGRVVLTWDWPDTSDGDFSVLEKYHGTTLIGPKPIDLPTGPMTLGEFDDWVTKMFKSGYAVEHADTRQSDSPIEEIPSEADAIEFADILVTPAIEDGELVIRVENKSAVPIPMLNLGWWNEFEVPQPAEGTDTDTFDLGGGMTVFLADPLIPFDHTLEPVATKKYLFQRRFLPTILGHMASLSPERYWLSISSGSHEISRIEGPEIGALIDQLEE